MSKKSFILHKDSLKILDDMSDEQAGVFIKLIYKYQKTGKVETDSFAMKMALAPFLNQFARDEEKYQRICKRNKANGLGGGRPKNPDKPKKPSGLFGNPEKPKKPDSDSESDSESESVNDLSLLPADAVRIAKKIVAHVLSLNPKQKNVNKPKLDKTLWSWSCDVDKLNRIDGRSWNDIDSVFNWVINDDFWRTNILSGSKLRKQFDTLYIKMNKNSKNDFPFHDIHGKYREVMVDGKLKKQYEDGTVR
jgi:hypothetical protein